MIHVTGGPVQGPDEFLVRKSSERRSREGSTGDNFVSHHLQTVEDGDGVGGELHPPVLLIPHVRGCGTFLPQDPELSERQSVHQTAARHVGLSDQEVGHHRLQQWWGMSCPGYPHHHYSALVRRDQGGRRGGRSLHRTCWMEPSVRRYHHQQDKQSSFREI